MSLEEVKKKYLQEALGKPIQKYGVDLGGGRFTSLSDVAGFYAESCPEPVTAKVEKKYLRFGYVAEEIPIEVIKKPKGFLGNRQLYTFTTPDLKSDNLKVDALDSPLIGKVTVKFTVPKACDGTDWVLAKKVSQSEDGSYTYVSGYAYTKKNQTKTTVIFKNVKPGVYYLTGRAYVKGYAKNYTKWSEVKKVVVK